MTLCSSPSIKYAIQQFLQLKDVYEKIIENSPCFYALEWIDSFIQVNNQDILCEIPHQAKNTQKQQINRLTQVLIENKILQPTEKGLLKKWTSFSLFGIEYLCLDSLIIVGLLKNLSPIISKDKLEKLLLEVFPESRVKFEREIKSINSIVDWKEKNGNLETVSIRDLSTFFFPAIKEKIVNAINNEQHPISITSLATRLNLDLHYIVKLLLYLQATGEELYIEVNGEKIELWKVTFEIPNPIFVKKRPEIPLSGIGIDILSQFLLTPNPTIAGIAKLFKISKEQVVAFINTIFPSKIPQPLVDDLSIFRKKIFPFEKNNEVSFYEALLKEKIRGINSIHLNKFLLERKTVLRFLATLSLKGLITGEINKEELHIINQSELDTLSDKKVLWGLIRTFRTFKISEIENQLKIPRNVINETLDSWQNEGFLDFAVQKDLIVIKRVLQKNEYEISNDLTIIAVLGLCKVFRQIPINEVKISLGVSREFLLRKILILVACNQIILGRSSHSQLFNFKIVKRSNRIQFFGSIEDGQIQLLQFLLSSFQKSSSKLSGKIVKEFSINRVSVELHRSPSIILWDLLFFTGIDLIFLRWKHDSVVIQLDQVKVKRNLKRRCINCQSLLPRNVIFCPFCGAEVVVCPICSCILEGNEELFVCPFCRAIGHRCHMQERIKVTGKCPVCSHKL